MSIVSLVAGIVSIVLGIVAIVVTRQVGKSSDRAIRIQTRANLAAVGAVVGQLRPRPSPDELSEYGAEIRGTDISPRFARPRSNVTMSTHLYGLGEPLFEQGAPNLRCEVTTPSLTHVFGTVKAIKDAGFECVWSAEFPSDFADNLGAAASTNDEGLYVVEWHIDDGNYGNVLVDAFYVLVD